MSKIFIFILLFFLFIVGKGQNSQNNSPTWGTLMILDKASLIVVGRMHVEDSYDGLGTIIVSETIKGNAPEEIKVQFTDRHPRKENTKQAEPPKYWYDEGQEGIWIITHENSMKRYELRQEGLFYDKKWTSWIKEKLIALKNREWSENVNGLKASVILDGEGANQKYRFFNLCLRNNSKNILYINTHYHIKPEQQRYEAYIITPEKEKIDMINGNSNDVRLYGMPGWPEPGVRDFKKILPGETIYLPSYGDMRCFARNPQKGIYSFHAVYRNLFIPAGFKGKVWTGEIEFPVVGFSYQDN